MQLDFGKLKGADGESCFIRYSANADGSDMTEQWSEGMSYIGFAVGVTAPTDKSLYQWGRFSPPNDTVARLKVGDDEGSSTTVFYPPDREIGQPITNIETVWYNDRFRYVVRRGGSYFLNKAELQYSTDSGKTWSTLTTLDINGNLSIAGGVYDNGSRVYSPNNNSSLFMNRGAIPVGADFDTLTASGFYQWDRANHSVDQPNAPTQSNAYGILEVINCGYFISQKVIRRGDYAMWVRMSSGGTSWSSWKLL